MIKKIKPDFKNIIKRIFVLFFLLMIIVPLLNTNFKKGKTSEAEKRVLAQFPSFYLDDGSLNKEFNMDFESWINDNIGFRSNLVVTNAKIQYSIFRQLANNSNMYLGPHRELNYATDAMLKDYQHLNFRAEAYMNRFIGNCQYLSDYCENKGIQLYYYQCWDKHSIYPEYFPNTVIQYGDKSKTDEIISAIAKTDMQFISPKKELIRKKEEYDTYSIWGDPSHWSQRGAYIGYRVLMERLNADGNKLKVLNEDDYNITVTDQGYTLFGGIHEICMLEDFQIKEPYAVLKSDNQDFFSENEKYKYFVNDYVDNNLTLLVFGDSYFNSFIIEDIAESFQNTIFLNGDDLVNLNKAVEIYAPDIIIIENAERCDRTYLIYECVEALKK